MQPTIEWTLNQLAKTENITIRLNEEEYDNLKNFKSQVQAGTKSKINWESDPLLNAGDCIIETDRAQLMLVLNKVKGYTRRYSRRICTLVDKRYLHYAKVLGSFNDLKQTGKVSKIVGLTIESIGPAANVGDLCTIRTNANAQIYGEVVGFRDRALLIMPFSELVGIGPGSFVTSLGRPLQVGVGPKLLGRILDGLGNPIDELGPLKFKEHRSVVNTPIEPLQRQVIRDPLSVGVRAIDGLLTCGRGQRLGIFAGSGVGKSTLLGMMVP